MRGKRFIWQVDTFDVDLVAQHFDLEICAERKNSRLLSGGRNASCRFSLANTDLVIRQYRRGGLVQRLIKDRYLWTGLASCRPSLEQKAVAWGIARGLPIPEVVAWQIERSGLFYRAAIISRFIENRGTLADQLAQSRLSPQDFHALGVLIRRMHDAGLDHADLNANNILIDLDRQFWLIDFDKAQIRQGGTDWQAANLNRLYRSLVKIATQHSEQALDFHFFEEDWQQLSRAYESGKKT